MAHGVPDSDVDAFMKLISRQATLVTPARRVPLNVRDPKDVQVLATAFGGGADYLVTGDNDLLSLAGDSRLGPLRIVTVVEFLRVLHMD